MEAIIQYFLKVSVLAVTFYLAYQYLLRRETFHRFGRAYLLVSLLLSLFLPLLSLDFNQFVPGFRSVMLPEIHVGDGLGGVAGRTGSFSAVHWLLVVYLSGVVVVLARLSKSLYTLREIAAGGRLVMVERTPVIITRSAVMPFSFLRWVFMDQQTWQAARRMIVFRHEKAHIDQFHSLDILFTEILKAIFWFNPVFWGYKRSLVEVHEYLADHAVVKNSGYDIPGYMGFLFDQASQLSPVLMTSHFNHSLLKRRFIMLTQVKSGRRSVLKISFFLPLVALLGLFIVSTIRQPALAQEKKVSDKTAPAKEKASKADREKVFSVVEVMPEYSGGHEAMARHIAGSVVYPETAKKLGIQGEVYVRFVVDETGKMKDVEAIKEKLTGTPPKEASKDVIKKNLSLMREEAVRVVSSLPGTWKPGSEKGKNVPVSFTLPIKFKLDDKKK